MNPQDRFVLALDQGTTSSRTVLYDLMGQERCVSRRPIHLTHPQRGWVEQDPEQIWQAQSETIHEVLSQCNPRAILSLGITNQRESVLAWDRTTASPLTPVVVWQCRRSDAICRTLEARREWLREETGLVPDPYFSGSKIQWLLEHTPGLRERVRSGEAVFGTIDSWLLFRLTGGKVFATEPSNASRTMLYSLKSGSWSSELCSLFGITPSNLPEIRPSCGDFGEAQLGSTAIPITAVLGDQQASLYGHGCFAPGTAKCTFGTGAFLLLNTGQYPQSSASGLLGTVAWARPELTFALEGSIFIAGALIQWLRDKLGFFATASEVEHLARSVPSAGGVVIVPAFVGLGAPHWDDQARGTIFGLTRDSDRAHLARAALEAVSHQVADLFECPEFAAVSTLSIDGGMAANTLFCQTLADLTARTIAVAPELEMTAFGVARLSAQGAGYQREFAPQGAATTFAPQLTPTVRTEAREAWRHAIKQTRAWMR